MAQVERFTTADTAEFRNHGLSVEESQRQLRLFEKSPPYQLLDRPGTIGDGVRALSDAEIPPNPEEER